MVFILFIQQGKLSNRTRARLKALPRTDRALVSKEHLGTLYAIINLQDKIQLKPF